MFKSKKMDLSTVCRRHLEYASDERSSIKEQSIEQKLSKIESRSTSFLLDKKYALKLDELI